MYVIFNLLRYVTLSIFLEVNAYSYFCDLKCGLKSYLCEKEPCTPYRSCSDNSKAIKFSPSERNEIVRRHNTFRSVVAQNGIPSYKTKVADMYALVYDLELEFVAICLANRCSGIKPMTCLSSSMYELIDFNYHVEVINPKKINVTGSTLNAFNRWSSTVKKLNRDQVLDYRDKDDSRHECYGAQLIWSQTKALGCSRQRFERRGYTYLLVICVYGPGGCVDGERIFRPGSFCTRCQCDPTHANLCLNDLKFDKFVEPFKIGNASAIEASLSFGFIILIHFIIKFYF